MGCFAMAQEEFVLPAAKFITHFPFIQLYGGTVIVRAQLDNIPDTLNFVLDTGSGGISLDSTTVEEFKIPHVSSGKIIKGIAGTKPVEFAYKHTLKLPGLKVDSLDFHINDYDLLTSVYGVKVDGVIGFSFLRKFIVKINYDSLKIEVFKPGTLKYPRGGYLLHPDFSSLPTIHSVVTDSKTVNENFIFDTGAGMYALLSEDFVEDSIFLKKKRKFYPTQAQGIGGKKMMDLTVVQEMNIGPYRFKKVPVFIFSDDYNVTSYPQNGGLIGNDLLRRFNVILNYPQKEIYIKPNSHFNDLFDYTYTGLGVYMVDGEITVIDIIKGSPAEKAGFKSDDIIMAIENNFTRNLQVFKSVLQNAGSKIHIIISRENQLMTLRLEIKNILRK